MTAKTFQRVLLAVPLSIVVDGRSTEVHDVTVKRPRTRHAIRLAAIIGADLVRAVVGDLAVDVTGTIDPKAIDHIDIDRLIETVIPALFDPNRLEATLELIGDLCGLGKDEAGDLDPADAIAIVREIAGFFPALQRFARPSSPPTLPLDTAGNPTP